MVDSEPLNRMLNVQMQQHGEPCDKQFSAIWFPDLGTSFVIFRMSVEAIIALAAAALTVESTWRSFGIGVVRLSAPISVRTRALNVMDAGKMRATDGFMVCHSVD